ncbi:hypothetical protein SAMN05421827_12080 [Pedobacter terrae]|uniref:DUF4142 domain-containing protein n=1 Tax=Pedobacter terrae TaxID=405671 RepID=A0A1G8B0L2_9SPHI|nr:hypothetical protein [Pedobacter terrae]SDH26686.1 hypothetical protein SAMN05421827_12080 [Pedobacter terrae]
MKFYRYRPSIILLLLVFTGCEKQIGDYRLERNDFLYPLAAIIAYQHVLDTEISKTQDQPEFAPFFAQRSDSMSRYIAELQTICSLPEADLTAEAKANLLNLQNSHGPAYHKLLLKLVMQADEDLIGLHVKASGPAGLKDVLLRQWTAEKLPMLTKRLDASQRLWHTN